MSAPNDPPSPELVAGLLNEIEPGSILLAIGGLPGSFSNSTHVVDARTAGGQPIRLVVRRYAVFGHYDRGQKARREYKTLELVHRHGIPAPEPVYLDETGAVLGSPGIVTRFVPGRQIAAPDDLNGWARALAEMLARIHAVSCSDAATDFLLDANAEATWFARSGTVPDSMRAHPDGERVWQTVRDQLPRIRPYPPSLVHIDYWLGNILWHDGRIAAVLDWEEAAYGDPGIDVAYCRMDLCMSGMPEAADVFLSVYEAETGRPVANLGLWELAAAARPMPHPGDGIEEGESLGLTHLSEAMVWQAHRRFVADAVRRLSEV